MANRSGKSKVIPFHTEPDWDKYYRQLRGLTAKNGEPLTNPGPELTADDIRWEPLQKDEMQQIDNVHDWSFLLDDILAGSDKGLRHGPKCLCERCWTERDRKQNRT